MFYSINPSRNFRAWISSAGRRLCTAAPFAVAALALLVLTAPAQAQRTALDADGDGLIEVETLEQLNAIRWDLDGNGTVDTSTDESDYNNAFGTTGFTGSTSGGASGSTCATCTGYELTADLDFDDTGSYASGTVSSTWTSGAGFPPIGEFTPDPTNPTRHPFTATFEGNRHTISNLQMDPTGTIAAGLFSLLGNNGVVRNVGLVAVEVTGVNNAGAVVGRSEGTVFATYATGTVTGEGGIGGLVGHQNGDGLATEPRVAASYSAVIVDSSGGAGNNTGGLVGLNNTGDIIASYATGAVTGITTAVGGLVGSHRASGSAVIASYSTGAVTPANGGGLIGDIRSGTTVTNSYWATTTSGISDDSDTNSPEGVSSGALQTPTGYTGIYSAWDVDVDGVSGNDDPWDFGTTSQYPVLKVNFGSTTTVFGPQRGPGAPTVTAVLTEGATDSDPDIITVTITRSTDGGDPASYQYRYNTDGSNWISWTTVSGTTFEISSTTLEALYNIEVRAVNTASTGQAATFTAIPADMASRDYDTDNDGLIEVTNLEQLNAIRYDLDGDGIADTVVGNNAATTANHTAYAAAFPSPATVMGCNEDETDTANQVCAGYELFAAPSSDTPAMSSGLDFSGPASIVGYPEASQTAWTTGTGWLPIGAADADADIAAGEFTAEFNGNGHAISNLFINRPNTDDVGLFSKIGTNGLVRRLALKEVRIAGQRVVGGQVVGDIAGGQDNVGGLAGENAGTIRETYVTGRVFGGDNVGGVVGKNQVGGNIVVVWTNVDVNANADSAGGLVGDNADRIAATYATGAVHAARTRAGGLVGNNQSAGTVITTYATGTVSAGSTTERKFVGGLIGNNQNSNAFTASYWDTETSGLSVGLGSDDTDDNGMIDGSETVTTGVAGYTTAELKGPTTKSSGIYATWDDQDIFDVGGGTTFDPWDLGEPGSSAQYPRLTSPFDGSIRGGSNDNHFGPQHLGPVSGLSATVAGSNLTISWNHDMDDRRYYDDTNGPQPSITCSGMDAVACYQYRIVVRNIAPPSWEAVPTTGFVSNSTFSVVISPVPDPLDAVYVEVLPVPLFGVTGKTARLDFTEPAAPTGVMTTVETSGVTVTWTAPTDTGGLPITGYSVQYRQGTSGGWTDLSVDDGSGGTTTNIVGTTATISGLTSPATYSVQVAAINAVGTGDYASPSTMADTPMGGTSNRPPTANAGPDQTVNTGATVTLDGSRSSDPDSGDTLGYTWTQDSGTTVTLSNPANASPTFTAPASPGTLVFSLEVDDGKVSSDPDTVTITVRPSSTGGGQQGGGGGGGNRGGGGGGGSRDLHGNTPARATAMAFRPASPRRATANGQISPASDRDYFTLTLPRAGLLIVETTGPTDTAGTVWQHDEELATAVQGGERRNFRLSTPVTAGPVLIAVTGNGNRTGAYTLVVRLVVGFFGNPRPGSAQSGVGVISGWVCEADTIEVQFEHGTTGATHLEPAATGTPRADTAPICGDADNGFGLLWNWNLLGDGTHTVRALVDGEVFAEHPLTVTTLGLGEFPEGLSGTTVVADFPDMGATTTLQWQHALQNFVIVPNEQTEGERAEAGAQHSPETAWLGNPSPGSYQSGIGVISGWVCEAETVEIAFEHGPTGVTHTVTASSGTARLDTEEPCGDADNGFGLLWNWNLLGDGEHIVRAFADGEEFAWSRVVVTTLGEESAQGLAGTATVADFPVEGQAVTVEWQEALQNFTITGRQ